MCMATDPHIGTRIKRARERKRWTQRQLAEALQVNIKTVDNWENGRTFPKNSVGAIEDVLEVRLNEPSPAIEPRDEHERHILANPRLTDDDKRLMIGSYRRAVAKTGRSLGQAQDDGGSREGGAS